MAFPSSHSGEQGTLQGQPGVWPSGRGAEVQAAGPSIRLALGFADPHGRVPRQTRDGGLSCVWLGDWLHLSSCPCHKPAT